jgi:septum formation inhibitor-activating ATPase MinD
MKKKYEKGNKPKSLDHNEIQRRIAKLEALGFAWSMVDSPSSIEDSP